MCVCWCEEWHKDNCVIHFKKHGFDLIRANSRSLSIVVSPFQFICILFDILLHARSQHQKLKQYSVSPKQCHRWQHQHSVQKFINGHSFLSHKQWAREAKTNDRWMQNTIKMKTVRIRTSFDGYDIHRPRKKEPAQNFHLNWVKMKYWKVFESVLYSLCTSDERMGSTVAAGGTRNRCDSKRNEIHLISSLRQRWQKYNWSSSAAEACA